MGVLIHSLRTIGLGNKGEDTVSHVVQAGVFPGPFAGLFGEAVAGFRLRGEPVESLGKSIGIGRWDEESADVVLNDFRDPPASVYSLSASYQLLCLRVPGHPFFDEINLTLEPKVVSGA